MRSAQPMREEKWMTANGYSRFKQPPPLGLNAQCVLGSVRCLGSREGNGCGCCSISVELLRRGFSKATTSLHHPSVSALRRSTVVLGDCERPLDVIHDALDDEFAELLPPAARPHERAEFLLNRRVDCLVHVSSIVETAVQSGIPCLVERCELAVLDDRANIELPGELPELLVVVALVTGQDRDVLCVPFHYLWCNLRIVLSRCRHVNIENDVGRCIDQQRRLQLLYGEVGSLRVVS